VLKDGLARAPGSEQIKKKLSLAESYLEERLWIEKRRAQQGASSDAAATQKLDTETKLNMIRCTKLKGDTALKACNMALKTLPDDAKLHRSKADALMAMDRVNEAILAYREALRLEPTDDETSKKLAAARSRRNAMVTDCQQLTGSAALRACDAALLEGAKDESAVQRRRGDLLLAMNRTAEAEEAYRRALNLSPDNLETKKKLESLTQPATVAKVDSATKSEKEESKPQESVIGQSPIAASTSSLSKAQTRQTLPPDKTAGLGQPEEGNAKPVEPSTPPFSQQTPKRYSNRPLVSGITH
jgi:tetratricopeptide (TPR) repeat protein